jgi:hypothetical protein
MDANEVDRRVKRCEYCRKARIVWAEDLDDARLPLDADPHPEGNFSLYLEGGKLRAGKLTALQAAGMRSAGIGTYRRHALSCPESHRWAQSLSARYAKTQRGLRAGRMKK